ELTRNSSLVLFNVTPVGCRLGRVPKPGARLAHEAASWGAALTPDPSPNVGRGAVVMGGRGLHRPTPALLGRLSRCIETQVRAGSGDQEPEPVARSSWTVIWEGCTLRTRTPDGTSTETRSW